MKIRPLSKQLASKAILLRTFSGFLLLFVFSSWCLPKEWNQQFSETRPGKTDMSYLRKHCFPSVLRWDDPISELRAAKMPTDISPASNSGAINPKFLSQGNHPHSLTPTCTRQNHYSHTRCRGNSHDPRHHGRW